MIRIWASQSTQWAGLAQLYNQSNRNNSNRCQDKLLHQQHEMCISFSLRNDTTAERCLSLSLSPCRESVWLNYLSCSLAGTGSRSAWAIVWNWVDGQSSPKGILVDPSRWFLFRLEHTMTTNNWMSWATGTATAERDNTSIHNCVGYLPMLISPLISMSFICTARQYPVRSIHLYSNCKTGNTDASTNKKSSKQAHYTRLEPSKIPISCSSRNTKDLNTEQRSNFQISKTEAPIAVEWKVSIRSSFFKQKICFAPSRNQSSRDFDTIFSTIYSVQMHTVLSIYCFLSDGMSWLISHRFSSCSETSGRGGSWKLINCINVNCLNEMLVL